MGGNRSFTWGCFFLFIIIVNFYALPSNVYSYIGNGIVINEVQPEGDGSVTNPDWVELYNNSDSTIDIGSWILNNKNLDRIDNNLIVKKNGADYNDTSYPVCKNEGGRDCLYYIPYDPDTLNDSDSSNDYTLNVSSGCYVLIYNTSGTNDYSCDDDNVISLYMGLDNSDIFVQDGDDVEIVPYFYYRAFDDDYNITEEGFIWLVEDYFAWEVGNNSKYQQHPKHCGRIKDGVFDEYPSFLFHYESDDDIDNQCSRKASFYRRRGYSVPFSIPVEFSTKKMDPTALLLHSSYSRVSNGVDNDLIDDFVVAEDTPGTTALKLSMFKAERDSDGINVNWMSLWEVGVIGFNIYGSVDGKLYEKLNNKIINSKGDMSYYRFKADNMKIKFVKLQIVEYGNHIYFVSSIEVDAVSTNHINNSNVKNGDILLVSHNNSIGTSSGCSSTGYMNFWFLILVFPFIIKFIIVKRETR